MFEQIPLELRERPQWVCFDLTGDGRKIPYIPGTDSQASSNKPTDWRSFRAAVDSVKEGRYPYIGYAFAPHDPYVFVDLDDIADEEQADVLKRLHTYAQRSVSGKGVHLICKGTFRGPGKHPNKPHAGIFKESRFCLMTGDVLPNRTEIQEVPTEDLQTIHSWLGGGLNGSTTMELVEYQQEIPDRTVYEMGCDRYNKFDDLCCGRWEHFDEYNGDHSSADHALISMLCDLTPCNEQVRWLFKSSGMWTFERREKKAGHGENGYIDRTISKARAKQQKDYERSRLVQLDFSRSEIEEIEIEQSRPSDRGSDHLIETMPDGLIKEIARHSFRTSYLPLQEASLLVGISLLSGMAGRGYLTPSGIGLNLWTVLVGTTGCGKDEYQSGMQRILNLLAKKTPSVANILGGEIASGPGLETVFQDTKRFISYVPEFDKFYKNTANPNGQPHQISLQQSLLNSFNTAGIGGALRSRRKAVAGEAVKVIERPCLCLVGESTPDALYASMSLGDIASGLLPRFMLLEVGKDSYSLRPNQRKNGELPPVDLMDRLERLSLHMDRADATNTYKVVKQSKQAGEVWRELDYAKRLQNRTLPEGDVTKELRNRMAMKVLRLSSLLALSEDFDSPRIELRHLEWSTKFVEELDERILARFTTGRVGSGQVQQEADLVAAYRSLSAMSAARRSKMGLPDKCAKDKTLATLAMLKDATVSNTSFASDKNGAVTAFHRCLDSLIRSGKIVKYTRDDACDNYGLRVGELLCMVQ